jgi:hypothetical protein
MRLTPGIVRGWSARRYKIDDVPGKSLHHLNLLLIQFSGQCYKTFYGRKLHIFVINKAFAPGKTFQSSLTFVGKAPGHVCKH